MNSIQAENQSQETDQPLQDPKSIVEGVEKDNLYEEKDLKYFQKQIEFKSYLQNLKSNDHIQTNKNIDKERINTLSDDSIESHSGDETFVRSKSIEKVKKCESEMRGEEMDFTREIGGSFFSEVKPSFVSGAGSLAGRVVYDIEASMKLDPDGPFKLEDYDELLQAQPMKQAQNKEINYLKDLEQLAPEIDPSTCGTAQETQIYESLPPFTPQKSYSPTYSLQISNEPSILLFNSKFESGNLHKAVQKEYSSYDLYLEYDTNSRNYTQWYYFSCKNLKAGQKVTFNIVNLMKVDSLYNEGMKPCVLSTREYELNGREWYRDGYDIKYKRNSTAKVDVMVKDIDEMEDEDIKREFNKRKRQLYCLSFSYTFKYDNDVVFFSHFIPYTYTDLQSYLHQKRIQNGSDKIMRMDNLCSSMAGNRIYQLTITNKIQTYITSEDERQLLSKSNAARSMIRSKLDILQTKFSYLENVSQAAQDNIPEPDSSSSPNKRQSTTTVNPQWNQPPISVDIISSLTQSAAQNDFSSTSIFHQYLTDHKRKKVVVLTCRVHPGESNSSFIMQGVIDFLLSREAFQLRNMFVFKIVPMLNPDGVIYGNYRCSLLGVDLNRRWLKPSKILHPTIYWTKQMMKVSEILHGNISMFCDIHGHSRKMNVFMYGCHHFISESQSTKNNAIIRSLPAFLQQRNQNFSFKDCSFGLEREKMSTARIVVFQEFGVKNSYTLEASFYGSEVLGQLKEPKENNEFPQNDPIIDNTLKMPQQPQINSMKVEDQSGTVIDPEKEENLDQEEEEEIENENENGNEEKYDNDQENQAIEEEKINKSEISGVIEKRYGDNHWKIQDLRQMGGDFCRAFIMFNNPVMLRKKLSFIMNSSRKKYINNVFQTQQQFAKIQGTGGTGSIERKVDEAPPNEEETQLARHSSSSPKTRIGIQSLRQKHYNSQLSSAGPSPDKIDKFIKPNLSPQSNISLERQDSDSPAKKKSVLESIQSASVIQNEKLDEQIKRMIVPQSPKVCVTIQKRVNQATPEFGTDTFASKLQAQFNSSQYNIQTQRNVQDEQVIVALSMKISDDNSNVESQVNTVLGGSTAVASMKASQNRKQRSRMKGSMGAREIDKIANDNIKSNKAQTIVQTQDMGSKMSNSSKGIKRYDLEQTYQILNERLPDSKIKLSDTSVVEDIKKSRNELVSKIDLNSMLHVERRNDPVTFNSQHMKKMEQILDTKSVAARILRGPQAVTYRQQNIDMMSKGQVKIENSNSPDLKRDKSGVRKNIRKVGGGGGIGMGSAKRESFLARQSHNNSVYEDSEREIAIPCRSVEEEKQNHKSNKQSFNLDQIGQMIPIDIVRDVINKREVRLVRKKKDQNTTLDNRLQTEENDGEKEFSQDMCQTQPTGKVGKSMNEYISQLDSSLAKSILSGVHGMMPFQGQGPTRFKPEQILWDRKIQQKALKQIKQQNEQTLAYPSTIKPMKLKHWAKDYLSTRNVSQERKSTPKQGGLGRTKRLSNDQEKQIRRLAGQRPEKIIEQYLQGSQMFPLLSDNKGRNYQNRK